jgi:energy-coupling factor transporter transmembrane protein EcfT
MGTPPSSDNRTPKSRIYIEDALILLGIVALFVLTVFFRRETWGQIALGALALAMAVIFVIRLRRVHRAFTGRDQGD